jgi:hypothetical protein
VRGLKWALALLVLAALVNAYILTRSRHTGTVEPRPYRTLFLLDLWEIRPTHTRLEHRGKMMYLKGADTSFAPRSLQVAPDFHVPLRNPYFTGIATEPRSHKVLLLNSNYLRVHNISRYWALPNRGMPCAAMLLKDKAGFGRLTASCLLVVLI